MDSGPFGQYASIIAMIIGVGIVAAWLVTVLGFAPSNPVLDSTALVIIGVVFGTGAGAKVVTNGVGKQAEAANTRLDALGAPPAPAAERIVAGDQPGPTVGG